MAIITAGYDGTVDEVQFAKLLNRYSVVGPGDFKATTLAGDRIVSIANGTALGPGTVDVATDLPTIQFASAGTGTRWDLVVLRRDWQPPGGTSEIKIIQGGTSDTLPAVSTEVTGWNQRPGIVDDQPLYLQEINGTLLGARIDLRCWLSNGGLVANHDRVRAYLNTPGTRVNVNGIDWLRRVDANDTLEWAQLSPGAWEVSRSVNTSSTFTGTANLAETTIANAPAGLYLINGQAALRSSGGANGYAFVKAGSTTEGIRWELDAKFWTATPSMTYVHTGGNLYISVGYIASAGTAECVASSIGVTKVRAAFLG